MSALVLDIEGLSVRFGDSTRAVRSVDLQVRAGQIVGLVGASGSGKSVTALAVLRLLPSFGATVTATRLDVVGRPVLALAPEALRALRGAEVAMIFQDPSSALNPVFPIGEQIEEAMRVHGATPDRGRVLALLREVGLVDAERRLGAFPHELSGGERQRVMIAIALANDPRLLLADEPTTALDAPVQAQLLALLRRLCAERSMGMLLVSHDLALVAHLADRVYVMEAGMIVEAGPTRDVLSAPRHPTTRRLVTAGAARTPRPQRPDADVLLRVEGLSVRHPARSRPFAPKLPDIPALDDVSFSVREGTTLGVVGESGSGKSTLAKATLRLVRATSGRVLHAGRDVFGLAAPALLAWRREVQLVFQDAGGALNPRASVLEALIEPLEVHGLGGGAAGRRIRAAALLEEVGLSEALLSRRPHELSGGERQRVGIARALAVEPRVLVCDECVSALDAEVQTQVLDLLLHLQQSRGLTYLFISHDLNVVARLAEDILVLQRGRVVEFGPSDTVLRNPTAPYTRALLSAAIGAGFPGSIETRGTLD